MVGTILISIVVFIFAFLVILTLLQLFSMYKKHTMDEIVYDSDELNDYPTNKWQSSSPEEQGVDSDKLFEMISFYKAQQQKNEDLFIDSITVIRNEHIIADFYFNPLFQKDEKHVINSCTKSIVSALIGIAIDKGYIKDVNVPILSIFEDIEIKQADERLKKMTLKDLLSMRTGWHSQDSFLYQWKGLFKMQATDDWVAHILNLPFETNPNTRFDYSNIASFLLSAIIEKTTGTDALSFAKRELFTPLGITDILWEQNPNGIYIGFARMWLKPNDLAKIGLLFLQKGKWENRQIVSESWVEESIKAHSFPKQYRYIYKENGKIDYGKSGGTWVFTNLIRPISDGYGYQWWLDESGMFSAIGVGGQYLVVVPKERLIVVVTSKLKGKDSFFPVTLIKRYILPAIVSQSPLPSKDKANKAISFYAIPPDLRANTKSDIALPSTAYKISNTTYSLDTSTDVNPWQYDNFTLIFKENFNYAEFAYTRQKNEHIKYKIGLNNQSQTTETNGKSYVAIGEWLNENTFSISCQLIGYSSGDKWILVFEGDNIQVKEIGVTGENNYQGKVKSIKHHLMV